MDGIRIFALLGLTAMLAACAMPSQKYGLAAPAEELAYPNINVDPTQKPVETAMTPEQLEAAKAELERRAGKKPSAPAFTAQ